LPKFPIFGRPYLDAAVGSRNLAPSEHPHPVFENQGPRQITVFPGRLWLYLSPCFAVSGSPHIPWVGIPGGEPASHNPELVSEYKFSLRISRLPSRVGGFKFPVERLCRRLESS